MASEVLDVLIEGTVVGTSYRKLICYDLSSIASLRSLKARVLEDLKAAGAPIDSDSEVVLRNYHVDDYNAVACSSDVARSCALADQDPWPVGTSACARLVAAAPCPRLPLDTPDQGRHAVLAIASRQFYDRARGDSAVLPLEARVKPTVALLPQPPGGDETSTSSAAGPDAARMAAAAPRTIEPTPFDIIVRDFRGRCHSVRVYGATSVQRLKEGIATALGCSVFNHWRLVYNGRPLVESFDLDDYNVAAGSVIDVHMTLKRGDPLSGRQHTLSGGSKNVIAGGGRQGQEGGAAGANSTGSGNHTGQSGSGSAGGSGDKGPGSQVIVQVLFPCGRLLLVPRGISEQSSHFLNGVLDAQKAMREPAEAPSSDQVGAGQALLRRAMWTDAAATAAAAARTAEVDVLAAKVAAAEVKQASVMPLAGLEVGVVAAARAAKGELSPGEVMAAAKATLSVGPGPRTRARGSGRRTARESKGDLGHKVLAVLLAAAAVMMALAVL